MTISQDIIDRTLSTPQGAQAYKIVETLLDAGFEAWWVGGCVRDMLLGNIPEDIDIATIAVPKDVIKLFKKYDDSAAALGTLIISLKGQAFEVTTFRTDHMLTDGRIPKSVTFADREEDAHRRDFTVNSMYWNPISGELDDPYMGALDLNEKMIRFIGYPEARIKQDALRLLRAIRFRALIGGQFHPSTFACIHKRSKDIEILSGYRRYTELSKILLGPHPEIAFEDLWETDIIQYLIPELHACKGVAQPESMHKEGDVWNHIIKILGSFTDDHKLDVRWAALLHDIGKPDTFTLEEDRIHFNNHAHVGSELSKKVLERLQCTAEQRDKISWLVGHHMMMGTFSEIDDERKAHWYYHPWFIELLQLFWLDIAGTEGSNFDFYESVVQDYNAFLDSHPLPPKPLLTGKDVMKILGIPSGEEIGRVLKTLYDAQIRKEVTTKKEAEEFIRNI